MATALSLSPLFRQSVGFDRFNDLFENLSEHENRSVFPPYDIVKTSDHNYQIIMAVAGYNEADMTINVEKDTLKILGTSGTSEADDVEYIHKGIAKRHFERTFRLADHMQVEAAKMDNGLLTISLYREVPEEQKLRKIEINKSLN